MCLPPFSALRQLAVAAGILLNMGCFRTISSLLCCATADRRRSWNNRKHGMILYVAAGIILKHGMILYHVFASFSAGASVHPYFCKVLFLSHTHACISTTRSPFFFSKGSAAVLRTSILTISLYIYNYILIYILFLLYLFISFFIGL